MSMTLRGMGSHKGELITAIRNRFGYRRFTLQQISDIPEFDRSAFFRLYTDKMILRATRDAPACYRLATRYSKRTPNIMPEFMNINGECAQMGGDVV